MKKTPKTMILAISIGLLGLVWVFAVAAYTISLNISRFCWGSIICTVAAVAVSELYLLVFRKEPLEAASEHSVFGNILTIAYFVITVLVNSVFALLAWGNFNWFLITLNLTAVVLYAILMLWVEQHTVRLDRQLSQSEQKTAPSREIARKLGELLAITEDVEIRGRLLKLKEAVDYGTSISTNATASKEWQMSRQLDEIVQLTIGRADRMIILNKISAAEMTWKMRSSTASSNR